MARAVPIWTGAVDSAGVLHLDGIGLFRRYARTLANQRVRVMVTRETRGKSRHQLGYLFGVIYPIVAEDLGYGEYEVSQLHDACMRELRGLQPEPNPLQLRVSLAAMSQDEVSRYIDDLRQWALLEHGIVTPDADLAEVAWRVLVRFCDRCGADVTTIAWSRLDRVTVPDAQGGGTIDRIWDLCAACMGQITAAVESSQAGRAIVVSMRSLGDLD